MPVSGLTEIRDLRHVIFTQEILHSQNVQYSDRVHAANAPTKTN